MNYPQRSITRLLAILLLPFFLLTACKERTMEESLAEWKTQNRARQAQEAAARASLPEIQEAKAAFRTKLIALATQALARESVDNSKQWSFLECGGPFVANGWERKSGSCKNHDFVLRTAKKWHINAEGERVVGDTPDLQSYTPLGTFVVYEKEILWEEISYANQELSWDFAFLALLGQNYSHEIFKLQGTEQRFPTRDDDYRPLFFLCKDCMADSLFEPPQYTSAGDRGQFEFAKCNY